MSNRSFKASMRSRLDTTCFVLIATIYRILCNSESTGVTSHGSKTKKVPAKALELCQRYWLAVTCEERSFDSASAGMGSCCSLGIGPRGISCRRIDDQSCALAELGP